MGRMSTNERLASAWKEWKDADARNRIWFVGPRIESHYLVLGAWGCGDFGNSPSLVASCFQRAFSDEQLTSGLNFVRFAIPYHRNDRNFKAFESCFARS